MINGLSWNKTFSSHFKIYMVLKYLFYEFFCFKRVHRAQPPTKISPFLAVVLGAMLAGLGYFITPQLLALGLLGLLFIVLSSLTTHGKNYNGNNDSRRKNDECNGKNQVT